MIASIKITPRWAVRCLTATRRLAPLYFWARSLGIGAFGLTLCVHTTADVPAGQVKPIAGSSSDPRHARLEKFFRLYRCAEPHHVSEYLRAADGYGLDYRLLPAVSIRETLCGVGEQQNNWWGYHPGTQAFPSVAVGIDYVARQLAQGAFYKGKTLREKLFTYNPRPAYAGEVEWIMRQIEN